MTAFDYTDFSTQLRRLGDAFNKKLDEQAVTDYFEDAKGYSWATVDHAIVRVRRTSRFFPRPVQLLDACIEEARARAASCVTVPSHIDHHAGVYACGVCQDSGFERGLVCDGSGVCHLKGCGVQGADLEPHPFTRRCACRATNPVLMRERDANRKHAPGVAA